MNEAALETEISHITERDVRANVERRTAFGSDPLHNFMASVQPTIAAVRKRILQLNAEHTERRAAILNRTSDELARLDSEHMKAVTEMQDILERLVEFRG